VINRKEAQELRLQNVFIKENGVDHVAFLHDSIFKSAEKGLASASIEVLQEDVNDIRNYLLGHGFDVEYPTRYEEQSSVVIIVHWD